MLVRRACACGCHSPWRRPELERTKEQRLPPRSRPGGRKHRPHSGDGFDSRALATHSAQREAFGRGLEGGAPGTAEQMGSPRLDRMVVSQTERSPRPDSPEAPLCCGASEAQEEGNKRTAGASLLAG